MCPYCYGLRDGRAVKQCLTFIDHGLWFNAENLPKTAVDCELQWPNLITIQWTYVQAIIQNRYKHLLLSNCTQYNYFFWRHTANFTKYSVERFIKRPFGIALCTTVAHNIAQNRPDNFPSYPPDNAPLLRWCLFERGGLNRCADSV